MASYLIAKDAPIHSIYSLEHFMTAHYSWYHGFKTKLYPTETYPVFQRLNDGHPLPLAGLHTCTGMSYHITKGHLLPQYIQIPWMEGDEMETGLCNHVIESLQIDGHKLYTLEKQFKGEVIFEHGYWPAGQTRRNLYSLDLTRFQPF